jgi:hypothetical protein
MHMDDRILSRRAQACLHSRHDGINARIPSRSFPNPSFPNRLAWQAFLIVGQGWFDDKGETSCFCSPSSKP